MLHQIVHDNRSKLWCGPAAIAAVTGQPTSVVTRALLQVRDGKPVKGIYNHELLGALRMLGYMPSEEVRVRGPLTLAEFAAKHRNLFSERPMIVQVTGHYVVLAGRRFVDSHTMTPVWLKDAPHRRRRVEWAWSFTKWGEPTMPAPRQADRAGSSTMAKAKRLAAKHGIEIQRDGAGRSAMWWVTCPALEHDDPHEGSNGAYSQQEVLEAVEDYVKCLTGGYLEAVTHPALLEAA